MPENQTPVPAPVSPTGAPFVPAKVVPYILGALAVVGVLLGAALDPDGASGPTLAAIPALTPYVGCLSALEALLFAALGASPGLRKVVPLVLVAALALPGCVHLKEIGRATLDCSTAALAKGSGEILGTVLDVIAGPSDKWRDDLDMLALKAGSAVVLCAVRSAYAELRAEVQKRGACGWLASCYSGGDPMAEIKYMRAGAWLEANGAEEQ